jgi:hypothetical protein
MKKSLLCGVLPVCAVLVLGSSCGSDDEGNAGAGTGGQHPDAAAGGSSSGSGGSSGMITSGGAAGAAAGAAGSPVSAAGAAGVAGAAGGGAAPFVPDVVCASDDDCTSACSAHGWPQGSCVDEPDGWCICVRDGATPDCIEGTVEGCPPGMHCSGAGHCMPTGDSSDGEPCPQARDCGVGLICVGYGGPLPNGETTACRRICDQAAPPEDCECSGAGYCSNSPSSGGAGGAGGAGGINGCPEMIENPGCADAYDTTLDFQSAVFQGCSHWTDLGDGAGWIHHGAYGGFSVDVATGLGWVRRTSSGAMTQAEAAAFCDTFSIVGLSDWRLPTIDEARSLAAGCPETAPGGSCQVSDPSCLSSSCGIGSDCDSCIAYGGPATSGDYCRPEVDVCRTMHTTSLCADCTTPGGWRYSPLNANFYSGSVDGKLYPVCVMPNVPNGVPCDP